jgi:hypothetical protein
MNRGLTSKPAVGHAKPTEGDWGELDPVVGWLVCWDGKSRGRDFRLKTGRTKIGREDSQALQLDDPQVSRDGHAFIVFDQKMCKFHLEPGEARGLVYINRTGDSELVLQPVELQPYDMIEIGQSTLVFVPFCKPGAFQWHVGRTDSKASARPSERGADSRDSKMTDDDFFKDNTRR